MASCRERETNDSNSDRSEITGIIRQCVREEIDLQRAGRQGTTNILHRTRDLIASATTSVSREVADSTHGGRSASYSRVLPSSSPTTSPLSSTPNRGAVNVSNPHWPKRNSTSGNSFHPWRFKKKKEEKPKPGRVVTKSICLIEEPSENENDNNELVPDYTLADHMILVKGYCDFSTTYTEAEIRKELSETFQQRFPLMTLTFFDFVKRERNTIITPVVKHNHKWDFPQVKELCGQGKLYVRLNVSTDALEMTEDNPILEESMENTTDNPRSSSSHITTPALLCHQAATPAIPRQNSSGSSSSQEVNDVIEVDKPPNPNYDSLQEMLPNSSAETIADTLSLCRGDINSTLDSLLNKDSSQQQDLTEVNSPSEVLQKLRDKMKIRPAKLTIDHDDLFNDAIAFYKNVTFDPEAPLRITFIDQPAIDGGGLLRQFFTDLFSCFIEGKHMSLFQGECGRMSPSHSPQIVFSGIIEIVGKIIAHSLVQGGPGFPHLSLPCYYYLATGNVISAMAYCDPWDIPDVETRQWVQKVMDASSESDMDELASNDEFMKVFSSCGDTTVVQISNKRKIIQSIASFEVIGKRKMALDQLRKGMKTLGLLDEIEKRPDIFESVFNRGQEEFTPALMVNRLLFVPGHEGVQYMLVRFVEESSAQRLQDFLKFCTGSKDLLPLQDKVIEVEFHDQSYIFSSTCQLKLQLPKSFDTYKVFETAMLAVMFESGRAFTTT